MQRANLERSAPFKRLARRLSAVSQMADALEAIKPRAGGKAA
jgi:hypothetical protein